MSQEAENKKDKVARCVISGLKVNVLTMTASFTATLTGKIKSEDKWSIENATTKVTGVEVSIADMITRMMVGWFWVRKIQDILRKGTIADARTALNQGYDWTESTTKKAADASPAIVGARVVAKMNTQEELDTLLAALMAKKAELEAAEEREAIREEGSAEDDPTE